MVSYARELFRAILHSPWVYGAALLLSLFLWLPLAGVGSTGGADMVESYVTQHAQDIGPRIQMLLDSGAADNIINLWKEAQRALDEAASSPRGSAKQLRAIGRYCQSLLTLCDAGYFAGADEAMIRANALTMVRVSELPEPVVYGTTHEMGAWPYLAFIYGQAPPVLWLAIAALVAGVGVSRQEPKGLLGQCPVNPGAKALASIGVTSHACADWLEIVARYDATPGDATAVDPADSSPMPAAFDLSLAQECASWLDGELHWDSAAEKTTLHLRLPRK